MERQASPCHEVTKFQGMQRSEKTSFVTWDSFRFSDSTRTKSSPLPVFGAQLCHAVYLLCK